MNTRYTALSTAQKLALNSESLATAIQLEAAEQGIPIPINLDEAINQMGYTGYNIPADAVGFYEIVGPSKYSGIDPTGVCYRTEAEALKAIQGAIMIREDGYAPNKKNVLTEGEITIRKVFLTLSKTHGFFAGIKQIQDDSEAYVKLCEEVQEDLRTLRQQDYDAKVIAAKRQKHLDLANGDEATAERFWRNLESKEWPTEPEAANATDDVGF